MKYQPLLGTLAMICALFGILLPAYPFTEVAVLLLALLVVAPHLGT